MHDDFLMVRVLIDCDKFTRICTCLLSEIPRGDPFVRGCAGDKSIHYYSQY
jgi:hypothetical protein